MIILLILTLMLFSMFLGICLYDDKESIVKTIFWGCTCFVLYVCIGFTIETQYEPTSNEYYLPAELYTQKDDISYIFIDEDGNLWTWEDDMYIYTDNHVYLLHMDNNNTKKDIHDDIILTVWSSGGKEIPTVG